MFGVAVDSLQRVLVVFVLEDHLVAGLDLLTVQEPGGIQGKSLLKVKIVKIRSLPEKLY